MAYRVELTDHDEFGSATQLTPVHFISLPDLIANKRVAGRTSDLAEHLEILGGE
jgi:hypothetical protein